MITMTTPRTFTDIDTWVFDLDNTLYPHHVNLWQQVDARIGEFVSAWLKITPEQARVIQKDYYLPLRHHRCAASRHRNISVRADDYLAYVHKIDHSPLEAEPGDGGCDRKTSRTQADPDQRLHRPRVGGVLARLGIG